MIHFMMLPVQDPYYCDVYEADKLLLRLIDDGMIVEFEPGKYQPKEEGEEDSVKEDEREELEEVFTARK
jgi:hypothetical protein